MSVTGTTCRTIVNPSRIPGVDYCANPYIGCQHECVYCYARHIRSRYEATGHPAGILAKLNAALVFQRQLRRLRPGTVVLSSMTDAYQPAEERFRLTRALLERMAGSGLRVSILTKSDLVVRDLDIFRRFRPGLCSVGMSLLPASEAVRRVLEPGAPSIQRRIQALRKLREAGIKTWAFVAPLLPGTQEAEVERLLRQIDGAVDHLMVDRLNYLHLSQAVVMRARKAQDETCDAADWEAGAYRKRYSRLCRRIAEFCLDDGIDCECCSFRLIQTSSNAQ